MKKLITTVFSILILGSALLLINGCKQSSDKELNVKEFKSPSSLSSIHIWWHWLDNSITKEGITKDLEAMKKQGISTATILNVGLFNERDMGIPQVKFNTGEWYQMFEWALKEANRVGIKIGVHNCDGWSSSGGPWIKPENSMKQCVWSKSFITGGKQVKFKLPEPKGNLNFYRDINVLAFPVTSGPSSFQIAKAKIFVNNSSTGNILYDGNPLSSVEVKNGTTIDIVFQKEFKTIRIAIHPRVEFNWGNLHDIHYQFDLKTSSDGKIFRTIRQIDGPVLNKTSVIEIQPIMSRYYRLELKNLTGINSIGISEIELLDKNESAAYSTSIPYHLEKTVTTMADNIKDLLVPGTDATDAIPSGNIIDLTKYMNPDGILEWDAPQGTWAILRIGYTTTGAVNGPATVAGTGLECDKMDTSALDLHFQNFPAKLIAHSGNFKGNTFEYLFIDSWECKYQNWTGKFASEFENRRHYSIINWLPVICGITVDNLEATERFLHDYRQTIAELIEENYYRQFNELCHQNGLKSHVEVIYGGTNYPPVDILKSNSYLDVPMFEFWAGFDKETGFINYEPVTNTTFEIPVHAAALYGKKIVPAEAYTGYANYSESPWDLKLFGDRAFCTGINQMVLHSYVHQPFEKKPGITLGIFGQSFNRHNPWWEFSSQWFTYHARAQYMLQQGVPAADILYFTGDMYNQEINTEDIYKVPDGYSVQKCNFDILLNHCTVIDGRLFLDNGMSYALLLLPDDKYMEIRTLKRIAELVNAGAVVVGSMPLEVAGNLNYSENEKALNALSDQVWGNAGNKGISMNNYGKGKVYSGKSMKDIMDELHVGPDFSGKGEGTANLLFIHKKLKTADFYFVVNQENKTVEKECIFRIKGKAPEIWDPQYGTVSLPENHHESNGYTVVKTIFHPKESLFFVFKNCKSHGLPVRQEMKEKYVLNEFQGTIEFEDLSGKGPIPITKFDSWTTYQDPAVMYYSGKAKYNLNFNLPVDIVRKKPVYLSIDQVKSAYEIKLNGKSLGCSAFPGFRFDVSGLIRENGNKLEIRVANIWRNRIIGDFTEYGELKNCWTTSPVSSLPGRDKPLQESGILGPVAFYY